MAKKKCTGLSVSRNNNVLTCKWSLPTNYKGTGKGVLKCKVVLEGQTASKVAFTEVPLSAGSTSCPITFVGSSYYPSTDKIFKSFIFKVRMGSSTNFDMSDECTYTFRLPSKPALSYSGSTGFTWTASGYTSTDNLWFQDVEYQTVNSPQATEPNWAAASVTSGTGGATGTQTFSDVSGYRHFRCRVRTIGGASSWTTISPICFAAPSFPAVLKNPRYSSGVVTASLQVVAGDAHEAEIQYAIETPATGYVCPTLATWTTGQTITINPMGATTYTVSFNANTIATNKALWIRVIVRRGSGS